MVLGGRDSVLQRPQLGPPEAPTRSSEAPTRSSEAPTRSSEAPTWGPGGANLLLGGLNLFLVAPTQTLEAPTRPLEALNWCLETPNLVNRGPMSIKKGLNSFNRGPTGPPGLFYSLHILAPSQDCGFTVHCIVNKEIALNTHKITNLWVFRAKCAKSELLLHDK